MVIFTLRRMQQRHHAHPDFTCAVVALHTINHAAKRGLLNTWATAEGAIEEQQQLSQTIDVSMAEIQSSLSAGSSDLQAAVQQLGILSEKVQESCNRLQDRHSEIISISSEGVSVCMSALLLQQIIGGDYELKLQAFNFRQFLTSHFGDMADVDIAVGDSVPQWMLLDKFLVIQTLKNALDNGRMHGEEAGVLRLMVTSPEGSDETCFRLENNPGPKHQENLDLQQERGQNTILLQSDSIQDTAAHIGSANSTFRGGQEMVTFTNCMGGSAELIFLPDRAVFTLLLPLAVTEPPSMDHLPGGMVFVLADDDAPARRSYTGLLRQACLNANQPDSVILGATYQEARSVVRTVCDLATVHGHEKVILICDQNMDKYSEGKVFGTTVVQQVCARGFKGLVFIRSANDDTKSVAMYIKAGANGALSKSTPVKPLAQEIVVQYWESYSAHGV